MEFIKLTISISGHYRYQDASNEEMTILGHFLATDVGYHPSSFKEWGINDDWGDSTNGNLTALDKDNNYILLTDLYSEEASPTALKMTREQYVQVINEWEEKVCKLKPKEVTIRYDNDEFIIETKD